MKRRDTALLLAASALAATIACTSDAESPEPRVEAKAAAAAPAVTPALLDKGRSIYKTNCVACHGEHGKGDGPAAGALKPPPRDHTDRAYMSTLTDEDLAKVIQMGGAIKGKPLMPSNPQIRGNDMNALVAYVRSLSAPQ